MMKDALKAPVTTPSDQVGTATERPRLHFIAKHKKYQGNLKPTGVKGQLDSGNWFVSPGVAGQAKAAGAEIHLHEEQDRKSWKAGVVADWRQVHGDPDRVIFTFNVDGKLERKQLNGWGRERAYVGFGDHRDILPTVSVLKNAMIKDDANAI